MGELMIVEPKGFQGVVGSANVGYVYIVEFEHALKIGRAVNPISRIRNIQTQAGKVAIKTKIFPTMNYKASETLTHLYLAEYRSLGEYFTCSFEIAEKAVYETIVNNGFLPSESSVKDATSEKAKNKAEIEDFGKSILSPKKHDNVVASQRDVHNIMLNAIRSCFYGSVRGAIMSLLFDSDFFFDSCQIDSVEDYVKKDDSYHSFEVDFECMDMENFDFDSCLYYCQSTIDSIRDAVVRGFCNV